MSQAQVIYSNQKYEKLKNLLKELFQLDQPDLDFGLYRIMHAKSTEITQFLDKDLLPQVKQAFSLYKNADSAEIKKGLAKAVEQAEALGADPDTLPKVKELRDKLANEAVDIGALENEVYDHLFSFFRRYYSEGDFLAKRVYKPGVYAIPYEGEEVNLYWANRDQYYIKTSDALRDYTFRLRTEDEKNPMRVHFRLVDAAEGEHGNIKAVEERDRLFVLASEDFITEMNGDLTIRFEYRPATISDWSNDANHGKQNVPTQKELVAIAVKRIMAVIDGVFVRWLAELGKLHVIATGESAGYSKLEAHLKRYVARNTFDYFIHKDLGGFLRRELDFYIKNEVMHLDDISSETATRVEQYLSKIKVIRLVGAKIIDFLAQLESFQDKLWRKKKFVIDTQYCVSLARVPDEFHAEIAGNEGQRREWETTLKIEEVKPDLVSPGYSVPLSVAFMKANPGLILDTKHFSPGFKQKLIASFDRLDESTSGICVMAENFQALTLLEWRLKGQAKCLYIDPPYNTDAGPIIYKNGYRNSSWLSLLNDRLEASKDLLRDDAIVCITIDDTEVHLLRSLADVVLGGYNLLGVVAIKNNPAGRTGTVGFSVCHEYALFYGREGLARVGRLEHSEAQKARYKERDEISAFEWTNFRKHGGLNTYRSARPRQFYPIYVEGENI